MAFRSTDIEVRMRFVTLPVVIGLALVGAMEPAAADTYREIEHTCPIDGRIFKWRTVMSASSWGARLDGRIIGATPVPWPHPVCPDNGFLMYREASEMTPEYVAKAKALVATAEYRRVRDAESPHFLGGFIAEKLGEEMSRIVDLYQDAAWDMENRRSDKHPAYLRVVVSKLADWQSSDSPGNDDWTVKQVRIAEALRQAGDFDDARAALGKVPSDQIAKYPSLKRIVDQMSKLIVAVDKTPL